MDIRTQLYSTFQTRHGKLFEEIMTYSEEKQWVKYLKNKNDKGESLARLLDVFAHTQNISQNKEILELGEKTVKKLKKLKDKKKLSEFASTTYKTHKHFIKNSKRKDAPTTTTSTSTTEKKQKTSAKKEEEKSKLVGYIPYQNSEFKGLENLGNTCYINSLLQLIAHCDTYDAILTGPINPVFNNINDELKKVQSNLISVISKMRSKDYKNGPTTEDLRELLSSLVRAKIVQNADSQYDATEILDRLLDRFSGYEHVEPIHFKNHIQTLRIGKTDRRVEHSHLNIQIEKNKQTIDNAAQQALSIITEGKSTNIKYFANVGTSKIDLKENYQKLYDETCVELGVQKSAAFDQPLIEAAILQKLQHKHRHLGQNIEIEKSQGEITLPKYLQIRLNRLRADHHPKIKEELTLVEHGIEGPKNVKYVLDCVVARGGSNKNNAGGHFWTFKKNGNRWIKMNDTAVTKHKFSEISEEINKKAYALFYKKMIG